MKATIRDVADAAGVSIGTVSRVLNGHSAVSDESRIRVGKVVRSLNYYPLRKRRKATAAAGLQGKRIAVMGLGLDRSLTSLSLIGAAIHAIESALAERGASLELIDLPRLDQLPVSLKQESLEGLILFGALQGNMCLAAKPALIRRLSALPSVWLQRRPEACWGDSVGPNDWLIGRMAADYLLERGHRRLAFLNPRADQTSWRIRELSFIHQAESHGAEVRSYLANDEGTGVFPINCNHDAGTIRTLVDRCLRDAPRATALFIPADSMAAHVYATLAARGLKVGKDLSLFSCNNESSLTDALYPAITTLDIHAEEIGRRALDQLAARIQSGAGGPGVDISLEPTFVEGESVARLVAA